MDYGEIITKAGKIIWKFKILWVFGLLATCSAGSKGSLNTNFQFSSQDSNILPPEVNRFFQGAERFVQSIPPWAWIMFAALVVLLIILAIAVGVIGHTAILRGAWKADEGAEHLGFGELFSESMRYFWRVIGLNLLVYLPIVLIVGAVTLLVGVSASAMAFSQRTSPLILLSCLVIPLCCLLVPVSWLLGVLVEFSSLAIIGENLGVIGGLKRAWWLISHSIGKTLLVSLMLFITSAVVNFILGLPAGIVAFAYAQSALFRNGPAAVGVGLLVMLAVYVPILLLLSSIIQAYLGAAWTLAFRRIAAAPPPPVPAPLPPVDAQTPYQG